MNLLRLIKSKTFSAATTLVGTNAWAIRHMTYSNSLTRFVQVASEGNPFSSLTQQNLMITSQNGLSWSQPTVNGRGWVYVARNDNFGAGLFCAVGNGMYIDARPVGGQLYDYREPRLAISTDGINWTYPTNPHPYQANDVGLSSVAISPTRIVVFGLTATNPVTPIAMTSTNGTSWSFISVPTGHWYQAWWFPEAGSNGQGLFVASGDLPPWSLPDIGFGGTDALMTSPDGINWTVVQTGTSFSELVWWPAQRKFLARVLSPTAGFQLGDENLTNWTQISNDASRGFEIDGIAYSTQSNVFIGFRKPPTAVVNEESPLLYYSYNGADWLGPLSVPASIGIFNPTRIYEMNWGNTIYSPELNKFVSRAPYNNADQFITERVLNITV